MAETDKTSAETTPRLALSIVIPVFNGARSVAELIGALEDLPIPGGHEIVLVNDGSADDSLEVLRALFREARVPMTLSTSRATTASTMRSLPGCVTRADTVAALDAADANASKAFFWVMGGVDIRQGRLSIFGHYIITSSAKGFMLRGPTHTLQGGVRYSLGTAKEGVTEEH